MGDYHDGGNKTHPFLEQEAWKLLQGRLPQDGKVLNYREAVRTLSNLRVNRKIALKLLKIFEEEGLLERRAGHGIRISKEGAGGDSNK